jgi:hypothetical protein
MKSTLFTLALAFIVLSCSSEKFSEGENLTVPPTDNEASYTVSFDFNWNKNDFPTDYPSNPHFSPLVGWVHQKGETLFQENTRATEGIKQMAERGGTFILVAELNSLIDNGKGLSSYTASGLSGGVGSIQTQIVVSKTFPSVSLATMLAPSPDWYVACVNVHLLDEQGDYVAEKTVIAHVYDAGTDSGATFSASNSKTLPQEPIVKISQPPLGNGNEVLPTLCMVTFKKK